MLVFQIKSVIILQPVHHTIEHILGLKFHFDDFAQFWFVHFARITFVLFLHPHIHHVDSVFGVLIVLHEFECDYFMDLFSIDTAVSWMVHRIKILVDWTMFCVKITRLTQNLEISSAYRTGSCRFYCLKRGWLWTWFAFLVDKLATWCAFYEQ